MRRSLLLALPFILTFLSHAQKMPKLPPDLPPYGTLKVAPAPVVRATPMPNRMLIWHAKQPGVPKTTLMLVVRGGLAADPPDRPGLADLLADTVTQGTRFHNARQIAEAMQAAGGDLNSISTRDAILLTTSVLSDQVVPAARLLAEVAQNATFPDDEVAIAKQNASDKLVASEADPSFLAERALAKATFGDYPYSRISATQPSIAQTTSAQLREEYRRRFRPDQALLLIVSDLDQAAVLGKVLAPFSNWNAPLAPGLPKLSPPDQQASHKLFLVERPGSVQTALRLAAFGPTRRDPDYVAARVANAIYGGTFGSRLVQNIREDKGYTYSPGSSLQELQAAGLLVTHAEVRNDVTGASLKEINSELNRVATTDVTEDELNHAKQYLIGEEAISRQNRDEVAQELAQLWIDGLPPDELARRDQQTLDTKAADVNAAGKKYFPPSRMTYVAVGEDKVIREQVAPLGVQVTPAP